jgi:hypothetical protein
MHRRVCVQTIDQGQKLVLRGRRRKIVRERDHAGRVGRLALVADIDLRGGVFTDEHDGEAGRSAARRDARGDTRTHVGGEPLGARLAVDDARGHVVSMFAKART